MELGILVRSGSRALIVGLVLLFAVACGEKARTIPDTAPENTSRLWGKQGELWFPASRLPDFSRAGYHSGDDPIPTVPVKVNVKDFGAVGDGVADDTKAFRGAIAAVENGAVLIPEGRYRITKPLFINKSNVVLRGAGRDSTTLYFPKTLAEVLGKGKDGGPLGWSWGGGWIWANADLERGDSNGPVWEKGRLLTPVTRVAKKGDDWLEVADASGIEAGQWVRITQKNTDGALVLAMHDGHTLKGRCIVDLPDFMAVNWMWKVTRVRGDRVFFDRALRLDVRPEWDAALWSAEPEVEEVGIERLTIEFPVMEYPGHHNEPGQSAISLGNTINSWVRNVAILNSDNGIFLWYAKYCTVESVVIAGRGGHYAFNMGGAQDCLVTRFRIENRSIHDTSFSNMANGNVYSWGKGRYINFDHHRGASYQNLSSRIHVGRPIRMWKSSDTASGHYTAAHETYWNIRPRAEMRSFKTWPAVNVIGRIRPDGRVNSSWYDAWLERVSDLEPEDLHLSQWARRKGVEMPPKPKFPRALPEDRVDLQAEAGPTAAVLGKVLGGKRKQE